MSWGRVEGERLGRGWYLASCRPTKPSYISQLYMHLTVLLNVTRIFVFLTSPLHEKLYAFEDSPTKVEKSLFLAITIIG